MKKEEIHIYDIHRLLFGNAPPEILIEVIIRTLILYTALIIVVRLLGKRTNSILTITERAVFITLGAIVAMPMHGPNHGILTGVVVLFTVLFLQRNFTRSFFLSRRWEKKMQGSAHTLIKDAVLDIGQLESLCFSRQQLYELLREREIRHLGQVKRAYIEASGTMSVYKYDKPRPGLSILPAADIEKITEKDETKLACNWCGTVVDKKEEPDKCPNCGHETFTTASKEFIKDE